MKINLETSYFKTRCCHWSDCLLHLVLHPPTPTCVPWSSHLSSKHPLPNSIHGPKGRVMYSQTAIYWWTKWPTCFWAYAGGSSQVCPLKQGSPSLKVMWIISSSFGFFYVPKWEMRETIKCGKYPRWFHCWFELGFFWWHHLVFIVLELSCGLFFFCIFVFESSHLRHDSIIVLFIHPFIMMPRIQPSCMCSWGERCAAALIQLCCLQQMNSIFTHELAE